MTAVEVERASRAADSARLLAAPSPDHATHIATYGDLPSVDARRFLAEVRASRLTGRGGAGFPVVTKLEAVAARSSRMRRAVVVANGAESEPVSRKDRRLLAVAPHLVLDGVQIAARVVGAGEAVVYVSAEAAGAVRRALAERPASEATPVRLVEAGDGFVAGQETAVVSRLNGGPARPVFSRERVVEKGVGGRPTLVQNVETLAHLALIARFGAAWFTGAGGSESADSVDSVDSVDSSNSSDSSGSTGTFLATVHPIGADPLVWEVPHGLPLRHLLDAAAGTDRRPLSAALVGGYHGTWLPVPAALDVPLSATGLQPWGGSVGSGVVIPLAHDQCGLEATAQLVTYLAGESARQCGPCEFGLPHLAGAVGALAARSAGRSGGAQLREIREAVGLVTGRGACHHPDGTARMVRSALVVFEQDAVAHSLGRCLAAESRGRHY